METDTKMKATLEQQVEMLLQRVALLENRVAILEARGMTYGPLPVTPPTPYQWPTVLPPYTITCKMAGMDNLQEEWDRTNTHIEWLKKQFCALHDKPQKDWDSNDHYIAREYRSGAISTGEHRYWILQRARKAGIIIK